MGHHIATTEVSASIALYGDCLNIVVGIFAFVFVNYYIIKQCFILFHHAFFQNSEVHVIVLIKLLFFIIFEPFDISYNDSFVNRVLTLSSLNLQ